MSNHEVGAMADDSPMETNAGEQEVILGPHWSYEIGLMLNSWGAWIGMILFILPLVLPASLLPWIHGWNWVPEILGAILMAGSLYYCHLYYLNVEYRLIKGKFILVSTGIISKQVDTIPLRFIFDCDLRMSPLERAFNVANLTLKLAEDSMTEKRVSLVFMDKADQLRNYILVNSAANYARVVAPM